MIDLKTVKVYPIGSFDSLSLENDRDIVVHVTEDYPGSFQLLTRGTLKSLDLDQDGQVYRRQMLVSLLESCEGTCWYTNESRDLLESFAGARESLKIQGLSGEPKDFQSYVLNFTLDKGRDFVLWNLDMGLGKGFTAAALMQELVANRKDMDLAIFLTTKINTGEMHKSVQELTELSSVVIDGAKPARMKRYAEEHDVYISNYDKTKTDTDEFLDLVRGKRVLLVADEAHKLVASAQPTKIRTALGKILSVVKDSLIVATSGTIVEKDPERFWRMFAYAKPNPLGSLTQFRLRYSDGIETINYARGRTFQHQVWNDLKLRDVPLRIQDHSITIRKTDPEISDYFSEYPMHPVYIDLSAEDSRLYDAVRDDLRENGSQSDPSQLADYVNTLSVLCSSPAGLRNSTSELGKTIAELVPDLTNDFSAKFAAITAHVKEIAAEGEDVILFTHWTNLVLLPLSDYLTKHKVRHLVHHGGMTQKQAHAAVVSFKTDERQHVFLSSDAGAHALNLQNAKYVINIEAPRSYDLLRQRNDRIHRLNSHIEDIASFVYVTSDTVEERIYSEMERRKRLSNNMQGISPTDLSVRDIIRMA